MEKEVNGVLLITPSAIMFDPEISTNIKDGIILPMTDVKKAALYHINNNTSKAWFQVWLVISGINQLVKFLYNYLKKNFLLNFDKEITRPLPMSRVGSGDH
jgi:hypothetical protein